MLSSRVFSGRVGGTLTLSTLLLACAGDPIARATGVAAPTASQHQPTIADTAAATRATILELRSRTNRGATKALEPMPAGLSVTSVPYVFGMPMSQAWAATSNGRGLGAVSNLWDHTVHFIDIATTTTAGAVFTNWYPTGLTFGPDGDVLYVATQGGTVDIIDPATRMRVGQWHIGSDPYTIVPHPTGAVFYVGTNTGNVHSINPSTGTILRTNNLSYWPINGLVVNHTGTRVYATNWLSGQFIELHSTTLATLRTWNLGGVTQAIALSGDGNRAIVANEAGFLSDVDLRTGDYVNYAAEGTAFGVVPDLEYETVGVTLARTGRYQIYNTGARAFQPSFAMGADIRRGVQDAATGLFMVTDYGLGRLHFFRR